MARYVISNKEMQFYRIFLLSSILLLLSLSCTSAPPKPKIEDLDASLAGVFSNPPVMMKDIMFERLLKVRSTVCKETLTQCSDLSVIGPALCSPADHAHWDWLSPAWTTLLENLLTETEVSIVFKKIQNCSATPTAGQLIATLELLKLSYKKKWLVVAEQELAWLKNRWTTAPDHIDAVLIATANALISLQHQRIPPRNALLSIGLLSVTWVPVHKLPSLQNESLMQWSMSLAEILPKYGQTPAFNSHFSHLLPRILQAGHLNWAMDVARPLCSVQAKDNRLTRACTGAIQKIRSESSTRPDIQLEIDYMFFGKRMRNIKNLKELSEQIDLYALRAQKWLPDLKPYIYKDATDTFSVLHDSERAQKYSNLYQDELKKMASH